MSENEYFDVPLCRVPAASVCFPKSRNTVEEEKSTIDSNMTTLPGVAPSGQVGFSF